MHKHAYYLGDTIDIMNIYFDGTDWIHVSENLCLVYPEKIDYFEHFCNIHIPLFTHKYSPKQGDVILDVGSGVGAEICVFSNAVGPSGHVYAIEADPELHKKNLKVVELLGLTNVTCINVAIMDKSGTVDIGIFSSNGVDSSIYTDNAQKIITVASKSIDDILNEYNIDIVDYIKINIEGAEVYALQGVSDISRIKNWCVSTHDFCGIKTKNFVVNFFNDRGILVNIHDEVENEPWKGGYVYAKS